MYVFSKIVEQSHCEYRQGNFTSRINKPIRAVDRRRGWPRVLGTIKQLNPVSKYVCYPSLVAFWTIKWGLIRPLPTACAYIKLWLRETLIKHNSSCIELSGSKHIRIIQSTSEIIESTSLKIKYANGGVCGSMRALCRCHLHEGKVADRWVTTSWITY